MGRWEVPHALGAAGSPIPRCLLHSSSSTHLHIPHPRLAKGRAGTAGQRRESRAGTVGQHTRGIAGGASPNRLDRTGPDRAAPNSSTGRAVPAPAPQSRPKRGGAQPVRWVRRRSGQRGADRNGAVRNGGRCRRLPGARRAGPGKGTAVGAGERRGGRRRSAVPTRSRGLQPRGEPAGAELGWERGGRGGERGTGTATAYPASSTAAAAPRVSLSQAGRWLLAGCVLGGEVFPFCHRSECRSHPEGIYSSVAVRGVLGAPEAGRAVLCPDQTPLCSLCGEEGGGRDGLGKALQGASLYRAWLQDGQILPRNPFLSIFSNF